MKKILTLIFLSLFINTYAQTEITQNYIKPYKLKESINGIDTNEKPILVLNVKNSKLELYENDKILFKNKSGKKIIYDLYENNILGKLNIENIKIINLNDDEFPELLFYTTKGNGMPGWVTVETYAIVIDIKNKSVLWNLPCYYRWENYELNEKTEWSQDILISDKLLKVINTKGNHKSGDLKGIRPGIYKYKGGKFYY